MKCDSAVFDNNANFYGKIMPSWHDYYFIEFINNHRNENLSLLDVGGGSGVFSVLAKDMCSNLDITVVDPSQVLLNRIPNIGINKVRGNLPDNLGLDSNLRFGYIHLREVLHHVVGHNVEDSRELVAKSLRALSSHLDDNGYIMIHEIFYEGYIIPPLSRTLIFYLLDIQQNIKIPINSKEFLKGLRVCFYTRDEFKSLLASCGYKLMEYKIEYWANNWKKNALLINNWGRMMYIAKKL